MVCSCYALLLECRDALARWGIPPPSRLQVHGQVRIKLIYASDKDLKKIGHKLEILGQIRNEANYDLTDQPTFDTPADAQDAVQEAADGLALLDAIDGDPARRAVAIASVRP
jgi:hypothetical protein